MAESNGTVIDRAFQIMVKAYQEIERLKDEAERLLVDRDSSMELAEQYSVGSNHLKMKTHHIYLFKRPTGEGGYDDSDAFVMACLFASGGDLPRVSLSDEPEVWFGVLKIQYRQGRLRAWDAVSPLEKECWGEFSNGEPRVGGDVCTYQDESEQGERWDCRFVGYPLVAMTDAETLKAQVFGELFA